MHADNQYLFLSGTVKMPIRPRPGKRQVVRQRKSCSGILGTGLFEAMDFTFLRIDAGQHVADDAILGSGITFLEK